MQEAAAKRSADEAARQEKGGDQPFISQDATMTENIGSIADNDSKGTDQMDDETALLAQALSMSMGDPRSSQSGGISAGDTDMMEADAEDQELAFALKMSVQDDANAQAGQPEMSKVLGCTEKKEDKSPNEK